MRIVINCLVVLLLLAALLSLILPVATFRALIIQPEASKSMFLFSVPALLFSVVVGSVVFRYFRHRDAASAKPIITASCFFLWLVLNTISSKTSPSNAADNFPFMLLHFLAPVFVAVLLNRLLKKFVDRAYSPATSTPA